MMIEKRKIGWPIFILLSLIPAFLWLMAKPISLRLLDLQTITTSLGQLAGLTGMAIFSMNLVLSARLWFLERYFGGLNRVYLNHHSFGAIALILLLFHPLLLVIKYLPLSLRAAAEFFLPGPGNTLAQNFGIFALLSMMIILVITFYGHWAYQRWKFVHQFLGLAFFLASLHVLFIQSDISNFLPLRIYLFTLVSFGFVGIFYRTLFSWLLVRKYRYRVKAIRNINKQVLEIELTAVDRVLAHRPGQFMFISFFQPGISKEYHPFTISSAPEETGLRLTVKHLGDFTGDLPGLAVGTGARIEGPFGEFSFLEVAVKKQIWIGGGIGITPFLSMARSLKNYSGYTIDLFYSVKTAAEAVFLEELDQIAKTTGQLRVIPFYTNVQGYLSAGQIEKVCGLAGKEIFVCGPPPLMKNLKEQLNKINIPRERVHSEEFAFL